LGLALLPGACAGPPPALPTYPLLAGDSALRIIAQRQARVESLSASCDLLLTKPATEASGTGRSISLDAILLAQPSAGRLRLRAWKLGRTVLDVTVDQGVAWVLDSQQDQPSSDQQPSTSTTPASTAQVTAAQVRAALDLLGPGFFQAARVIDAPTALGPVAQGALFAQGPALGRPDALCEIDLATLTVRRFALIDGAGQLQAELVLRDYALVAPQGSPAPDAAASLTVSIPIPTRITVRSASGGTIDVRLSEPELNAPLALGAFTPPARAQRLAH
jgi:hypothetical protein